jgi:hypothetical protein
MFNKCGKKELEWELFNFIIKYINLYLQYLKIIKL